MELHDIYTLDGGYGTYFQWLPPPLRSGSLIWYRQTASTHCDLCFYAEEMLIRNLIRDVSQLNKEELQYVNNRASLDFVVYRKIGKSCVMAIEVDGFEYHENNPEQIHRDRLKNTILEKYKIPLLRLPANHSGEVEKIKKKLDELL